MKNIKIITERAITKFSQQVDLNKDRVREMWLISPWIRQESTSDDALTALIDSLVGRKFRMTIVTRPPKMAWHLEAIDSLSSSLNPLIYYDPYLHAKLYLMDCDGFRYALFGSANLTGAGDKNNRELSVELRAGSKSGRDNEAVLIQDLFKYAKEMLLEDNVQYKAKVK